MNRRLKIEQRPTLITIRIHRPTIQRPTPMLITIGNHKPTTRPTPIGDSEIEQKGESKQKGEKKPVKEISDGREEIGRWILNSWRRRWKRYERERGIKKLINPYATSYRTVGNLWLYCSMLQKIWHLAHLINGVKWYLVWDMCQIFSIWHISHICCWCSC